ncbi:MAG: Oligopeptide ABC transporter, periplasmic oligopeptide-binding protein OppA [uncultured Thermomicrobiales bacterium]|uniref:Oligopeptide ABC transporter, periplasmic oligopeptide-binding protein OppA n=1 Tax=uncultured Thermomicrobiales bacterium TaxID=1645740 RepID=A0A6J4TM27_9BACT|nr:MAG: Oligopeptide ABC transporter, periplasmic oligopeptide-binding protein OppA [uncultured Thermomicrobiales bacterium]
MLDRSSPTRTGSATDRADLDRLVRDFAAGAPRASRRDLLRFSALAAGAVATTRLGVGPTATAGAAPAGNRAKPYRYQDAEIEENATVNVPFNPYGQDIVLDPHRATNWGPFWTMFPNVWGGLVRYDQNAAVELDLAESFTKSDDGLVYTFKLRPDARYANGRPVLAEHFVVSWRRALDPERPSPMASFLQHVEGYEAYVAGESEEIGFGAVDDATVEITLSQPFNYFLSYLAAFVWNVVDPDALEEFGEDEIALHDAGTGPWRFTAFDPETQIVMEPNTNHYGGNSPSIATLVWPIVSGPSADADALALYRNDEAVSADVPLSLKQEVEDDETLSNELIRIEPSGSTRSLAMDFRQAPFDDVRVRRAFAQAIDRDAWANEIWQGTYLPTTSFIPPVVGVTGEYEAPEGLAFDPDEARSSLEAAGFANGEGLPEIVFYQNAEDSPEEIERWRAFLDLFQETLNVGITHDTTKTLEQIQDLQTDNGGRQFDVVWWWNIAETPQLLSDVCRTDSAYMRGVFNWSADLEPSGDFDPGADAATLDDLVGRADIEQDEATRNDLYRQAEELVLRNAVYVPLGNWVQMFVQKPWLQGTRQGPWTGRLPVRFDQDVVVLAR